MLQVSVNCSSSTVQGWLTAVNARRAAASARESGVATRPIADFDAYREQLSQFVFKSGLVMRPVFEQDEWKLIAVGAVLAGTWFWWKTRAMRRQIREQMSQQPPVQRDDNPFDGRIIEGEVIRDSEAPLRPERLLR